MARSAGAWRDEGPELLGGTALRRVSGSSSRYFTISETNRVAGLGLTTLGATSQPVAVLPSRSTSGAAGGQIMGQ
jgi:hypothetical protein